MYRKITNLGSGQKVLDAEQLPTGEKRGEDPSQSGSGDCQAG